MTLISPVRFAQRHALRIVLLSACALLYAWFAHAAPAMYLDVVIHSERSSDAEVFYASAGQPLSRSPTSWHRYPQGESRLLLPIFEETIASLRFDPSQSDNPVSITRLRVVDRFGAILAVVTPDRVSAGNEIAALSMRNGALLVTPVAGAKDPSIFLNIGAAVTSTRGSASPWIELAMLLLLGVGVRYIPGKSGTEARYGYLLAALVAVACVSALVMVTSRSVNPDETMHVGAARYYLSNWLPPAIGDSRVASDPEAYGPWGFSYLDDWDVCYFLAGKFAVVLSPFIADETIRFRLFDVVLLAVLAWIGCTRIWARPLLPILLISPQVWYIFSYFNGDAFALVAACLAVLFLADRSFRLVNIEQTVGQALRDWRVSAPHYVTAAVLIALVVLSKRNFWTVLPFVGLLWGVRVGVIGWLATILAAMTLLALTALQLESQYAFSKDYSNVFLQVSFVGAVLCVALAGARIFSQQDVRKHTFRLAGKLAVLALLVAFIAAPRILWDHHLNGGSVQKAQKLEQNENRYAIDDVKPATVRTGRGLATNRLQDRGYTIGDMFAPNMNWHGRTVASFFGSYGYGEYPASRNILLALFALAATLCGLSLWQVMAVSARRIEIVVAASMIAVVIGNSILASWIVGFQAQGRYLFPILPFAFLYLDAHIENRTRRAAWTLAIGSAIFGLYSFLCQGLVNLIQ